MGRQNIKWKRRYQLRVTCLFYNYELPVFFSFFFIITELPAFLASTTTANFVFTFDDVRMFWCVILWIFMLRIRISTHIDTVSSCILSLVNIKIIHPLSSVLNKPQKTAYKALYYFSSTLLGKPCVGTMICKDFPTKSACTQIIPPNLALNKNRVTRSHVLVDHWNHCPKQSSDGLVLQTSELGLMATDHGKFAIY